MSKDLWSFALSFYADADVQKTCLALQDDYGADVNIVICLLWRAARGEIVERSEIDRLDKTIAAWRQDVVRPLRQIRRRLKLEAIIADRQEQEAFRTKVKGLELEAERLEMRALEAESEPVAGSTAPSEAAERNLFTYFEILAGRPQQDLIDILVRRTAGMSA